MINIVAHWIYFYPNLRSKQYSSLVWYAIKSIGIWTKIIPGIWPQFSRLERGSVGNPVSLETRKKIIEIESCRKLTKWRHKNTLKSANKTYSNNFLYNRVHRNEQARGNARMWYISCSYCQHKIIYLIPHN